MELNVKPSRTRIAPYLLAALLLFLTLLAGACGPKFDQMSAQQIYEYGQNKLNNKSYQDAIDAYEALIDLYPFSLYVTDAELGIADSHFMKRQWVEAEASYDAFAKRHPSHPKVDHALFRSGMSSYKQKLAIDRDLTATEKAESQFSSVVSRYPDSGYYGEARLRLKEVRNDLAKRERYVAKHYWRDGEYYAAFKRYERVIRLYSDTDYYEEALYYGARCLIELDERGEAKRYLELLVRKYPEGKYVSDANKLLGTLQ